jgi:hypothetical protein
MDAVVLVLFLSGLVIGAAEPKDVLITISQRMLTAFDVAHLDQVPQLWWTHHTLPQWATLNPSLVWVLAPWLALLDRLLMVQEVLDLALGQLLLSHHQLNTVCLQA